MSLSQDAEVPTDAPGAEQWLRRAIRTAPLSLKIALVMVGLAGIAGVLFLTIPGLQSFASRQSLIDAFAPPFTSAGLLGTDQLGRAMEWRLLAGFGISLSVALSVTAISLVLGLVMGVLAGLFGKTADRIVSIAVDVAWAYPAVLLAVVMAGILGPGLPSVVLALGLSIWAAFARIVRAQVLSLREQDYVLAARALGYGRLYIAVHHLVPILVPIGLVMASFYVALAVIAEAGLSFIGLGAQAPTPSLGGALAEGYTFISSSPWPIVASALTIIFLVTTFNRLGDHLRDALDPHQRGRRRKAPSAGHRVGGREVRSSHTPVEAEPMIRVEDLTVVIDEPGRSPVPIVSGLTLDIRDGQTLGIVGESGSGKSVTARAIMGLLSEPLRMTDDSLVAWEGRDIATMSQEQQRRRRGPLVSMVFQDPRASLDPLYPIGRQIAESLEAHGNHSRREVQARMRDTLQRVGLDEPGHYEKRYPHELSGGQLQRAMIAAALILDPRILLADEPTTGLDVTTQRRLVELVSGLKADLGMAVVWITHDLDLVSDVADHLVVMYAGEAVETGSTGELLGSPRHPYTADLLRSRPQAAERRKVPLTTIPGGVPEPGRWHPACRFAPRCRRVLEVCEQTHPQLESAASDRGRSWRCVNPEPREDVQ